MQLQVTDLDVVQDLVSADMPVLVVQDVADAQHGLAVAFYNAPSQAMTTVGVVGEQ